MSAKTVRLYGHVQEGLEEFSEDDETADDAVDRLLPDEIHVIEIPEDEIGCIWVSEDTHERLKKSAGDNISMSEVLEYHLREEGYISEDDVVGELEIKQLDAAPRDNESDTN